MKWGVGARARGSRRQLSGGRASLSAVGSGASIGVGFGVSKSSPQLLGSLTAEQAGHRLGDVFLELYIATCANLLELVN